MEKLTQKYTIIQLLEPMEEGAEWSVPDWPLHVTLADIFTVDWREGELMRELSALLSKHQPFTTTATHDEYFGDEKQTLVTLLDMNEKLVALHSAVVALLKDAGAVFNTPQYIEAGYRAHVTVRPHAHLDIGAKVIFDALTLVDMFPDGDPYHRRIIKTINLGKL